MNLDEELALTTPEINPVEVHSICCPTHGFNLCSMPRNEGETSTYAFKCVLRFCLFGI